MIEFCGEWISINHIVSISAAWSGESQRFEIHVHMTDGKDRTESSYSEYEGIARANQISAEVQSALGRR